MFDSLSLNWRRVPLFALIAFLFLALVATPASARTERLKSDTRMHARPKNAAKTVMKLREGQPVRILDEQGGWIKVAARGKVGWIKRSAIEGGRSSSPRDRGSSRAPSPFSVGDTVEANSKAPVRIRPADDGEELFVVSQGEILKVVSVAEGGDWVRIEDETGTTGWIVVSALSAAGDEPFVEAEEDFEDDGGFSGEEGFDEPEGARDRGGARARDRGDVEERGEAEPGTPILFSAGAGLGLLNRTQEFKAPNATGLENNYRLGNTTGAVLLHLDVDKALSPKVNLGATAWYYQSIGGNGIAIEDPAIMDTTLDWKTQNLGARARLGYWASPKIMLVARVAYMRHAITIEQDEAFLIPSEAMTAITGGLGLAAPKVTPKLGLYLAADFLLSGSFEQMENLADGESSKVSGLYGSAALHYEIGEKLNAIVAYGLTSEKVSFEGMSTRAAENGERKDLQHIVTAGVGLGF